MYVRTDSSTSQFTRASMQAVPADFSKICLVSWSKNLFDLLCARTMAHPATCMVPWLNRAKCNLNIKIRNQCLGFVRVRLRVRFSLGLGLGYPPWASYLCGRCWHVHISITYSWKVSICNETASENRAVRSSIKVLFLSSKFGSVLPTKKLDCASLFRRKWIFHYLGYCRTNLQLNRVQKLLCDPSRDFRAIE